MDCIDHKKVNLLKSKLFISANSKLLHSENIVLAEPKM